MSFTKRRPFSESIKIIEELTQKCMDRGGPISHDIGTLMLKKDYRGVIGFVFDYETITVDDAIYARQIQGLVAKQDFLDLGVDKKAVAINSFHASESKCAQINAQFRKNASCEKPGVEAVMSIARRKIASILGDVPNLSELTFTFGSGTTTSTNIRSSNALGKLGSSLECSKDFLPYADEFLNEFPAWKMTQQYLNKKENIVKWAHGKLSFVPKNAKTKRSIIVEPILNALYQKAFGSYIKKRLKLAGLDLYTQTPNQELAREGSELNNLSTIDLSAASDHVSYGLVLDLLPISWFNYLEIGRTAQVIYKTKGTETIYDLQKFSSMGNGYTFELESLIFYGLACAVCQYLDLSTKQVRVYGDDIIIPVTGCDLLIDVLEWCGFSVNSEKSYITGRFRESCGADYLDGIDIRPFYLKDMVSERVLYLMHNWFIRHCEPDLAKVILKNTDVKMHLWGPDGYGDGHLIGEHSLRSNRKLKRKGFEGGFFDTYCAKPKRLIRERSTDWIYPAYSIYVSQIEDESEATYKKEVDLLALNRTGITISYDDWVKQKRKEDTHYFVSTDCENDPFIIRGYSGYHKISIYTLADRIFHRSN